MYNKLYTKILDSSIWLEPNPTRIVWITFLAAMDEDGFAQFSSVRNLANRAMVTVEEATAAVQTLENPDGESANKEHDGRRIERVDGGWMILNAGLYRDIVTRTEKLRLNRERVARHRAKKSGNAVGNAPVMQSEAYSEAESKNPPSVGSAPKRAAPRKRCPDDWKPDEYAVEAMRIECPDVNLETATRKFRDHEFARARKDWLATWRNWIREEQTRAAARPRLVQPAKRSPPTEEQISAERRKAAEANRRELAAKVGVIAAMPR